MNKRLFSKHPRKKRPLTLLEVVIGFALTAILLASLFSSFRHVAGLGLKVKEAREKVYQRALIQLRLSQLFNQLILEGKGSAFTLERDTLHFTFQNDEERDPKFCGAMDASLFLDSKKQLCLTYGTNQAKRNEILFTHVKSCSFELFNPQKLQWERVWKEKSPPPLLKMHIDQTTFTFLIPEIT